MAHLQGFLQYLTALLLIIQLVCTAPTGRPIDGPFLAPDFADPSLLKANGSYYAFSTASSSAAPGIHIPVARSHDLGDWSRMDGVDALPFLPPWAYAPNPRVWAPDVNEWVSTGSHSCGHAWSKGRSSFKPLDIVAFPIHFI